MIITVRHKESEIIIDEENSDSDRTTIIKWGDQNKFIISTLKEVTHAVMALNGEKYEE